MFCKICFLPLLSCCVATSVFAREWTDKTGRFRTEAEFRSVENGAVELEKPDGTIVKVRLDRLSDSDRAFAEKIGTISRIHFPGGGAIEGRILKRSQDEITILSHWSLLRFSSSVINSIE